MLRLLGYEIKKIIRFPKLWLVIAILLLLNPLILYYQEIREYRDPQAYYKEYQNINIKLENWDYEKQLEYLDNEELKLNYLKVVTENGEIDQDRFASVIIDYQEGKLEYLSEFNFDYEKLLNQVKEELEYQHNYPTTIQNIIDNANKMETISIFAQPNSFSYHNIIKTRNDYQSLNNQVLEHQDYFAAENYLKDHLSGILIILISFLLAYGLIGKETKSGMIQNIRIYPRGKGKTYWGKILLLVGLTIFMTVIFEAENYLFYEWLYGYKNLSYPVFSLPNFFGITKILSFKQMIGLTLIYKILVYSLLALFAFYLETMAKKASGIIGIMSIILLPESLLYYLIPANSVWNSFKYLNIISFYNLDEVFYTYRNIHVFNQAVSYPFIVLVIILVFSLIFISLAYYNFRQGVLINLKLPKLRERKRIKVHNYYYYDFKKLLFKEGVIWILILGMGFMIAQISITSTVKTYPQVIYQEYLKEFHGTVTSEKKQQINELVEKVEAAQQQVFLAREQMNQGLITREDYYRIEEENRPIMNEGVGITQLASQLDNETLVDQAGYEFLFEEKVSDQRFNSNYLNYLVIIIVTVLTIVPLTTVDLNGNIDQLYHLTLVGKKEVAKRRIIEILILDLVIFIIYLFPKLYFAYKLYFISDLGAKLGNTGLTIFTMNMPIIFALVLDYLLKFLGIVFVSLLVTKISRHLRNYANVIGLSLGILILPVFGIVSGLSYLKVISLSELFIGDKYLLFNNYFLVKTSVIILFIIWSFIYALKYNRN